MQRMGMVIGLKADRVEVYKRLHAAVWPEILAQISACNIKNYSIFLREPENLLFGYWEYHGSDFAADMARMAEDPETQAWWAINTPLQRPLETRAPGVWWAEMTGIFHFEGLPVSAALASGGSDRGWADLATRAHHVRLYRVVDWQAQAHAG